MVLDPDRVEAVELATRQLDTSTDFPLQDFGEALTRVVRQLQTVASWRLPGYFEHRLLPYNPGFSLVAFNPHQREGSVIVEFHGFHNESTNSRMHVELRRADSERWYTYWIEQFEHIWDAAQPR